MRSDIMEEKLKQAFGGTGYNEEVRHFPDFASRMYFMEAR